MSQNPFERFRKERSPSPQPSSPEGARASKKPRVQVARKKEIHIPKAEAPPKGLPEKLGSLPLRLIIVGHNPSEHAWKSGHYYSNPSNRMWKILKSTGIAPEIVQSANDDNLMLPLAGVGFTDVGCGFPGTDSSQFSFKIRREWSEGFLKRLRSHLERCNASIGCTCGECGAPRVVAFVGKSQYISVHNATCERTERIQTVEIGKQNAKISGWPFPENSEVWVLPSTSGASALTNEDREGPFFQLAAKLKSFPWPDPRQPKCAANDKTAETETP